MHTGSVVIFIFRCTRLVMSQTSVVFRTSWHAPEGFCLSARKPLCDVLGSTCATSQPISKLFRIRQTHIGLNSSLPTNKHSPLPLPPPSLFLLLSLSHSPRRDCTRASVRHSRGAYPGRGVSGWPGHVLGPLQPFCGGNAVRGLYVRGQVLGRQQSALQSSRLVDVCRMRV